MKAIRIIFISLIILSLGACSMMGERVKPVSVTTIAKQQPMYHPPLPMEVQMDPVDWEILTPDSMQLYLDNLKSGEAPKRAFYSLSSKEYEHLSMDMADITRYITEIMGIIRFYRDYDKEEEPEDNRRNKEKK